MTGTPRISVVLVRAGDAVLLDAALTAMDLQTVRSVAEVILVDDGELGKTDFLAVRHDVRLVTAPPGTGSAAACNLGWRAASAPIVAFTHDDCRPREDWLARILTAFLAHPQAAGVGGQVVVDGLESFTTRYLRHNNPGAPLETSLGPHVGPLRRLALYLRRSAGMDVGDGPRPVSSLVGSNMAFRRETLERVGGFDERFDVGGEEDLCRRVLLQDDGPDDGARGRLFFDPAVVVDHTFRPDLADTFRRSRIYGHSNARMFLKHRGDLTPVLYPMPFVVAGLFLLSVVLRRRWPALAAVLLPPALFSRWVLGAVARRSPEMLLYPYVQLAQEAYNNLGLAEALREERGRFDRDAADV